MEYNDECEKMLYECFVEEFNGRALKLKNLKANPKLEKYSPSQIKAAACALADKNLIDIPQRKGVSTQLEFDRIQLLPHRK